MKSKTTADFRKLYAELPAQVKRRARKAYLLWKQNPSHPGVRFKRVNDNTPIYSARIGLDFRALGILKGETVIWYWIGKHDDYERLLR